MLCSRLKPGAPLPKSSKNLAAVCSPPNETPSSSERRIRMKSAPKSGLPGGIWPISFQVTYTSPLGPTAGREPCTHPAAASELRVIDGLQFAPPSVERVNRIESTSGVYRV